MKKKDGTFIILKGANKGPDIKFTKDDDVKAYIQKVYDKFEVKKQDKIKLDAKLIADQKAKQEETPKVDTETTEKKEEPKVEDTDIKEFKLKDHMYSIKNLDELYELGKKMLDAGGTIENIKQWARSKIMNRKNYEIRETNEIILKIQSPRKICSLFLLKIKMLSRFPIAVFSSLSCFS